MAALGSSTTGKCPPHGAGVYSQERVDEKLEEFEMLEEFEEFADSSCKLGRLANYQLSHPFPIHLSSSTCEETNLNSILPPSSSFGDIGTSCSAYTS